MPNLTPAESSKLYRKRNPERWKQSITKYQKKKWTCQCGSIVSNKMRPVHLKSKKHHERMDLINNAQEMAQYVISSSEESVESD